jgi:hypothetical protein
MIDLYLKFDSEAEATAVLYDDEMPRYTNIDTIGLIYRPTGEMLKSKEGEYPEMAAIPGWHVNVRLVEGEDSSQLNPYTVQVENPVRVWA